MSEKREPETSLPLKNRTRPIVATTLCIAVLLVAVSLGGLLDRARVYPTEAFETSFVPNDVVNLFLGLPVLLGSLWLIRQNSLVGLLFWPGALLFVLYNTIAYLFALPLSWLFLLHLSLVALCLYALITLVASIDAEAVMQRLQGNVPERFAGTVLAALGLLFFLRVIVVVLGALLDGGTMAETDLAVNISDYLTAPAMMIGGLLLWQKQALGYAAGLGLLFQASMLFIALIAFLILQPILTGAPFAAFDVLVVAVMGLICFVPFALFLRGTQKAARM